MADVAKAQVHVVMPDLAKPEIQTVLLPCRMESKLMEPNEGLMNFFIGFMLSVYSIPLSVLLAFSLAFS